MIRTPEQLRAMRESWTPERRAKHSQIQKDAWAIRKGDANKQMGLIGPYALESLKREKEWLEARIAFIDNAIDKLNVLLSPNVGDTHAGNPQPTNGGSEERQQQKTEE